MTDLFISDLHLCATRPLVVNAFLGFLERQAQADSSLYILGDLFDVWVGDDDDSPFARRIEQYLAEGVQCGCSIFLLHGNRDFLLGEEFCRRTGLQLLPDPSVIRRWGQRILLMHGDSLCWDDLAYQEQRKLLRSPSWQAAMRKRPLAERRRLAGEARERSRRDASDLDVSPAAVSEVMAEHAADLLIHGHTHLPGEHPVSWETGAGRRIVLGDWRDRLWFARLRDGSIELIAEDITT